MKTRSDTILVVILLSLALLACGVINMDDAFENAKNVSHAPIIVRNGGSGPITITMPPAAVGPYTYTVHRGSSTKSKFSLGDRVILDPDSGAGPGTISGRDIQISTGKSVVYITHDSGIVSYVLEDDCKPYIYLNVGDNVAHATMALWGTVMSRNNLNGKDIYEVQWDNGSTTEEELRNLVLVSQHTTLTQMPPPPPSCDCGAKSVGSDRHSSWCTLSDLTSLN